MFSIGPQLDQLSTIFYSASHSRNADTEESIKNKTEKFISDIAVIKVVSHISSDINARFLLFVYIFPYNYRSLNQVVYQSLL